jgi:hypothetical protein
MPRPQSVPAHQTTASNFIIPTIAAAIATGSGTAPTPANAPAAMTDSFEPVRSSSSTGFEPMRIGRTGHIAV